MAMCPYCEQDTPDNQDDCVNCGAENVHESVQCETCGEDISHDINAIAVGNCVNCYAEDTSEFDDAVEDEDDDLFF